MDDLKKCPYCGGYTMIVEFSDGSGHIECERCYQSFDRFGRNTYTKEEAINRFNKYIGK